MRQSLYMRTLDDGTFEFPHVEAHPFQLEVSHLDYRMARVALGTSDASVTVRLVTGAIVSVSAVDAAGRPLDADVRLIPEEATLSWENLSVVRGTGSRKGLEPGRYWAQVLAGSEGQGSFAPQRVEIPEEGALKLSFAQRKESATLVLRAEGLGASVEALVVPGAFSVPVTRMSISLWAAIGGSGVESQGARTFTGLPPGRVRILLFTGSPFRFHLEELELPAEGVVERVVHPDWQPMPEK